MEEIKVEIANYYNSKNEGILKGNFTLIIHPQGQKILHCKHFENEKGAWFVFPSHKVIKGKDTEYYPYVSYIDKEYLKALQIAVVNAINTMNPNEKRNSFADKLNDTNAPKSWF